MSYVLVADFKYGMDRRRPRIAGTPGTMWNGINVHISRGGDIERAKKFVPTYNLPEGTFGIGQIKGQLYVFGSGDLSGSMPPGVQYQRLQNPATAAMTRVLHNNTFDGKHYVVAEFADGSIDHFYDGTRVDDWGDIAIDNSEDSDLADWMARKLDTVAAVSALSYGSVIQVTSAVAGTAFTISATFTDEDGAGPIGGADDQTVVVNTPTANVAGVAEVRSAGTITITGGSSSPGVNYINQVTADGVDLLAVPVDWVLDNTSTALALSVGINNQSLVHGYAASAAGAVVTIKAAVGTGATPNGDVVARSVAGNVTATVANFSGGVTEVVAVAQISTVTIDDGGAEDKLTVTLNGTAYVSKGSAAGSGTHVFTYKSREYACANQLFYWCKINDPTDWTTTGDSGAGFLSITNDSEGADRLLCTASYEQNIAIFSRKSIRIYTLSTVASDNEFIQALDNTGTIAPRSVLSYSNSDVYYLDDTGIRSLQVRQINEAAFVNDIGSAIDPLIAEWLMEIDESTAERSVAVIEPIDGRYMLAIGERIYVLSYFPRSKVNAWTYYEPGFTVTDFARVDRRLYARDTDTIYLLGGADNATYPDADELPATVELPFVSAGKPSTFKQWQGFDMALEGEWRVDLLPDPNNETKLIGVGVLSQNTYGLPHLAVVGEFPLFAMKATMTAPGPGKIISCIFHYEETEAG